MAKDLATAVLSHNIEIAAHYTPSRIIIAHRQELIDWLFDTAVNWELELDTFFLAVNLADRYLAVTPVSGQSLTSIYGAALLLSSIVKESYYIDIDNFERENITGPTILSTALQIFIKLQGNIAGPTILDFIRSWGSQNTLAINIGLGTTLSDSLSVINMATIAQASIYLASEIPDQVVSSEIQNLAYHIIKFLNTLPSTLRMGSWIKNVISRWDCHPVEELSSTTAGDARSDVSIVVEENWQTRYYRWCVLGEGSFAEVYAVKEKSTDYDYAIKCIPSTEDDPLNSSGITEISNFRRLNHPNIIKLHEIYIDSKFNIQLVMDYCGWDLRQFYQQKYVYSGNFSRIVKQIAEGLNHIHECGLIHRDIKPQNIFVTEQHNIKIGDLGIGKLELLMIAI